MEKDFDFGFHQHLYQPPPDLNLLGSPFEIGHLNTKPGYRNPKEDSPQRNVAPFPVSCLQQSQTSEPNNSRNWFHLMPQSHHAFAPILNSAPKQNIQTDLFDLGQQRTPAMDFAPARKRYLVFDHSGDKTTLIYSSGLQLGAYCVPNPPTTCNLMSKVDSNNPPLTPSMDNEENIKENSRDFTEDDHEDTEELNALLNDSDFSEDCDDDEETSTGHSPSTMTTHDDNLAEESGDEVDSVVGPTKRQKLCSGGYDVALSRANKEELGSLSGCKRLRREKMHETVSILQSIIPGVDGKDDAVVVIDEAIRYLRSLKVKAKALGLDGL